MQEEPSGRPSRLALHFIVYFLLATLPAGIQAASAAREQAPLSSEERAEIQAQLEMLRRQIDALEERISASESSDESEIATTPEPELPEAAAEPAREAIPEPQPQRAGGPQDLWARDVGRTRLRLMDLGLDVITTVGGSTSDGEELQTLQGGAHDPRQRGFTLNQVELSFVGAVDPYLRAETYIVLSVDPDGETVIELEEAFLVTQTLPFGLQDKGFQIEGGTYFTDFGRINQQHPHFWTFVDQPFVATRFLGGDALRGPGALLAWLTPLPWYSEFRVSTQNARGETQVSFFANEEVYAERPIGGRPFVGQSVSSASDLTWSLRWANGFDISDTWSSQIGASVALGPNATGRAGDTQIYGGDVVAKWRPLTAQRGWPFVVLQGEFMWRNFQAAAFDGLIDGTPAQLPEDTLRDWGLYAYGAWGFQPRWVAGFRGEYGTAGGGPSYVGAQPVTGDLDPWRGTRYRVSPLVAFHPSEFSRLRLQYNYDNARFIEGGDAHSVWFGVEFNFGAHPAHSY
jgi:hypothetical protein